MSEKKNDRTPPEAEPLRAERIKLLIVDDEVGYVNVLSNRLRKRNVDVTKSFSGTEGIQVLRRHDFDVAVLDLKMEDMDGIEVLKIFKKMDPEMAVIMLTGHGSEMAAKEGIEYGAFDYLLKPCELEELLAKIKEACQKKIKI
ncbi:MAG: response regulator [Deltaproteobacteria bacterium]|nr:response regulator [Deltaproteobacteria bacterium]MBW1939807.1 response regulator [Deltaproteobacteria bacterium]MBW2010491.1 response regulator [Deltaproteobacteria bacterium]MBW2099888.1 response regulator [Deltaproteobacteria bacterium]